MPRAIATARDILWSNDRCESPVRFERPSEQALVLATEPRRQGLFFIIPVSSPVATFKQSKNVAIAHVH